METEVVKLYFIGIDIGGTWLKAAITDENYRILNKISIKVKQIINSPLESLENIIKELAKDKINEIFGIGIAAAGKLDFKNFLIIFSPNSSIRNLNVTPIEEKFNKPIKLINDGVAAALAEWKIGAGINYENIVFVNIGSGIGGGIIVDNHLLMGKEGNAHEFGHMIIDIYGTMVCKCGGRGHWEAYTSGNGLINYCSYLAKNFNYKTNFLNKVLFENFSTQEIFEYARKGDEFALYVINEANRINSIGMANLINLYDPEIILMGGSVVMNNIDLIINSLNSSIHEFSFNSPPKIVPSKLGENASIIGAIIFLRENYEF